MVDLDLTIDSKNIKHVCENVLSKNVRDMYKVRSGHKDNLIIKSIIKKVKDNNLILTKADKGNSIVILTLKNIPKRFRTFLIVKLL